MTTTDSSMIEIVIRTDGSTDPENVFHSTIPIPPTIESSVASDDSNADDIAMMVENVYQQSTKDLDVANADATTNTIPTNQAIRDVITNQPKSSFGTKNHHHLTIKATKLLDPTAPEFVPRKSLTRSQKSRRARQHNLNHNNNNNNAVFENQNQNHHPRTPPSHQQKCVISFRNLPQLPQPHQ
jgi:hypothetical protein